MPTVNIRAFSHKKSTVIENGGPKLPTAAQLELGEIAMNFAKGYETLSIKNNNNEIVTFTNDNYWINKELAIAAALNDLNDRKQDVLEMDETPTEGSENVVTSGGLYSYITEIEQVTAAALNDLNDRVTSLALSDDYAAAAQGTPPLAGDTYETAISKLHKVIVDDELITSSALNDLNSRIDNLSLSEDYEATDIGYEPESGDTYEAAISKLHGAILENELATSGALNDLNARISNMALSEDYEPSSLSNEDLFLEPGDSYETAFSKLEKTINDNENITSAALTDLDSRLNSQSLDDIPDGSTRRLVTDAEKAIWNNKSDFSGSYNDLSNKPTTLAGYGITDAINTSSTAQTKAGSIKASKFITSGGTSSQVVRGDGSLVDPKLLPQYEAYLEWGGKNFSASYGPIDAAMVSELGAPRTMFAKAAGIVVEYSTDGGSTWVDYGANDTQKVQLFSTGYNFYTGKSTSASSASANNMLRVSLYPGVARIYTSLNKFVIFVTTFGSSGCYCTIRCRTQQNYEDNVDTWVTIAEQVPISGWSGYNVINIPATTTYGFANAKATQYGELQFIFGYTDFSSESYPGLAINKIFGFGGVGWTCPSTMAKTGYLYSFDANQNATFPSQVTATSFKRINGTSSQFLKADGSVDSNTYLTSHQQLKTINNESLIGTGNITIQGGGNGEANVIETIKVNGTALTPDSNKAVNITSVPASIVTQDATHRFVSDTEKTTWNGKQNALQYYTENSGNADIDVYSNGEIELACLDDVTAWNRGRVLVSERGVELNYKDGYAGTDDEIENTVTLSHDGFKFNNKQIATTDQIPSAVTESTVSGWGFTKNAGTITGITMNGASKGTSGVVDLGTVITSETALSKGTTIGNGNAVTDISVSGHQITLAKGSTFLTSETDPVFSASAAAGITSSDITNWNGKTSNVGTVTGVKMNGTTNNPTSGVVDLGTVITSETALSKGTTTGSGNAVTDISVSGHLITLTKGSTFLTNHQGIKTLKTDNTTAQSTSSSEAIAGSGTINLHKVAKTGTYSDLIGTPTIPTVNNATLTIQKNGTTVNTFTANASSNVTANIQVNELPTVSSSDNGKVLMVVNGAWSLVMPTSIYSGTSTPDSNTGNNGDIYLQTS